jgi:DNA-directed RNA polymerase alpha subunit
MTVTEIANIFSQLPADRQQEALAHMRWLLDEAKIDARLAAENRESVDSLGLSRRARNALQRWDDDRDQYVKIRTLAELRHLTEFDLKHSPGMGKVSIAEIKAALAEHGLSLWPAD